VARSTPAVVAAERAGITFRLHEYPHEVGAAFGTEAAEALGVDAARVFKTLMTVTPDRKFVVAVVAVDAQLDLRALGGVVGSKGMAMADARDAERVTGYVVGGISPLGQRKRQATVVDESAHAFDTIFCSGGRRGLEIELAPADLIALTAATTAPIARP
jgi:Cys-tRNA(Pro)/Cys-tRNA(Cys) deacylase